MGSSHSRGADETSEWIYDDYICVHSLYNKYVKSFFAAECHFMGKGAEIAISTVEGLISLVNSQ